MVNEQSYAGNVVRLGGTDLAPITRETVNDKVYNELRRSLIQGVFATGEVLRIADLALKFQTSTMPVRDALSRLVSENALEALPNRSVRVPLITRERLEDLSRARVMIEGQVTLLAMERLQGEDFRILRNLTVDCEKGFKSRSPESIRTGIELNHAFHHHIYRAADSNVMNRVVESLWLQSGPYVRKSAILHNSQQDPAGTHHHWELIVALECGDGDAALKALKNDIMGAFNLIRAQLELEESQGDMGDEG